uniref:AMP-activated protein kinase glycogen-binding domain-containing protein n=1 Tax=Babesia bovis TaxID=5865 RepID=S6C8U7_BABBO|nr:hypothetical protein [Babesia bovis]
MPMATQKNLGDTKEETSPSPKTRWSIWDVLFRSSQTQDISTSTNSNDNLSEENPPKLRSTFKSPGSFIAALQTSDDISHLMDDLRIYAKLNQSSLKVTDEKTMAVFHWRTGGNEVYLMYDEGGERIKAPMRRNGKSFMAVRYIPREVIEYTFLVDGIEMCSPDLPTKVTPEGKKVNIMDGSNTLPIEKVFELDYRDKSIGEYGNDMPDAHYMSQDPLTLPNAMMYRSPDFVNGDRVGNDIHVMSNHIYEDTQSATIFGPGYTSYITIYGWECTATDISIARNSVAIIYVTQSSKVYSKPNNENGILWFNVTD